MIDFHILTHLIQLAFYPLALWAAGGVLAIFIALTLIHTIRRVMNV
jgi:hypothetical protein